MSEKIKVLEKIELFKNELTTTQGHYKSLNTDIDDVIGVNLKITIDLLKKHIYKLEDELKRAILEEKKESIEAPIRELSLKIYQNTKEIELVEEKLAKAQSLSRHDPKNEEARLDSFVLANLVGDLGRSNAKLIKERSVLLQEKELGYESKK